jgi:predicted enzyme related to lactoylglutathione lyase
MGTPSARFVRHDLMTTDVAAASVFYRDLFGWQTSEAQAMGSTVVRLSAGGKVLGAVLSFDRRAGAPSHWIPYVYVDSVEDCCRRVSELKGEVSTGPTSVLPGRFAVVNDPQKALFAPFTPEGGNPAETAGPAMGQFCWDELVTSDVDGARAFYSALFGWGSKEWDPASPGRYTLFTRGAGEFAGVMKVPAELPRPTWLAFVLVPDVAASVASARRLGGRVVVGPQPDVRNVGRYALLADPTGGVLGVFQPG